jgi:hypothetical protein
LGGETETPMWDMLEAETSTQHKHTPALADQNLNRVDIHWNNNKKIILRCVGSQHFHINVKGYHSASY